MIQLKLLSLQPKISPPQIHKQQTPPRPEIRVHLALSPEFCNEGKHSWTSQGFWHSFQAFRTKPIPCASPRLATRSIFHYSARLSGPEATSRSLRRTDARYDTVRWVFSPPHRRRHYTCVLGCACVHPPSRGATVLSVGLWEWRHVLPMCVNPQS